FELAFFISGGRYSLTDLPVVNFFRPGNAQPPPRNVWKRLHRPHNNPPSEKSLFKNPIILVLHSLSVNSEIFGNPMDIN
ncbi:hypothetical protein, partial [Enterobacter intestinihominis]